MVEAAVKELFGNEVGKLTELINKQDERSGVLEKACQDLSAKLDERSREAQQLRENLEKLQQGAEASGERIKALEGFDSNAVKERIARLEDDADGVGGLQQVRAKLDKLEGELGKMQPSIDESSRLVSVTKSRTDEFDLLLRRLSSETEDLQSKVKSFNERLDSVESLSGSVNLAQQALEDSVSKKYECLWQDVLHAIEEVRGGQMEVMREDLERQQETHRKETQSLVNYGLQCMALAHTERRKMVFSKTLITAWREQTWIGARRRAGIAALHRLHQQRQRYSLNRWISKTAADHLVGRLADEYERKIPNVAAIIEETGLPAKCSKLEDQVATLEHVKCTTARAETLIEHLATDVDKKMEVIPGILDRLQDCKERLQKSDELHRSHTELETKLEASQGVTSEKLHSLEESLEEYAKNKEVQGMMRDVLLIWNSIKQLDVAKADKKDVDNFALETSNRDKQSTRHLEDLRVDLADKARQELLRNQEKWNEVDGRFDESTRNFRHWEQMWEKLSGFVEDLVTKISELQAANDGRPSSSASTLRPSSRSRSRAEIPTLPAQAPRTASPGQADADALRGGGSQAAVDSTAPTMDSKLMWIAGAKSIVDMTLDQAAPPRDGSTSSRSRPARPKSASAVRPRGAGDTKHGATEAMPRRSIDSQYNAGTSGYLQRTSQYNARLAHPS